MILTTIGNAGSADVKGPQGPQGKMSSNYTNVITYDYMLNFAKVVQIPGIVMLAAIHPDGKSYAINLRGSDAVYSYSKDGVQEDSVYDTTPSCLYFSDDGTKLAIGLESGIVQVCTLRKTTSAGWISIRRNYTCEHSGIVTSLRFLPDSHLLLSGGTDGLINLTDVDTGTVIQGYEGHKSQIIDIQTTNGPNFISAGGFMDDTVRYWDMMTGREQLILKADKKIVALAMKKPELFIYYSTGKELTCYSLQERKVRWQTPDLGYPIDHIAIDDMQERLYLASKTGEIQVYWSSKGKFIEDRTTIGTIEHMALFKT